MRDELLQPEQYRFEHVAYIAQKWEEHMGVPVLDEEVAIYLQRIHEDSVYDGFRIGSRFTSHSKLVFRRNPHEGHYLPDFNENMDRDHPRRDEAVATGNRWRADCIKDLAQHFPQLKGLAASLNND